MIRRLLVASIVAAVAVFSFGPQSFAEDGDVLKIGSKAPNLDIEHWFSDGNGKFSEVENFENGKVYVVEFWATWCGPCIASMPHLSELQTKYYDKGVQIISISDEDQETVEEFLDKTVRGEEDQTYAELTGKYCLTADPDESSHDDYMKAANQNGIPSAFIVGKDGKIEWIGHPMAMDEPLEQIVAGEWDRVAYVKKKEAEEKAMADISKRARKAMRLMEEEETEEAMQIMDSLIEDYADNPMVERLKGLRMEMAMSAGGKQAADALTDFAKDIDNPMRLNEVAWFVVEMQMNGDEVDEELVRAARDVAQKAVDAEPKNAAILDTLAHLVHMSGDLDKAIKIQKEAVENAEGGMKSELEDYLEELEKELAKSKG